ncbi:MAG: hypothetical protein U0U46_07360 [Saprospiraceae bacterium]|nr:hypothetical protein [Saprospiraceae bacterium]
MRPIALCASLLLFTLTACQSDPAEVASSPENVLKQWQSLLDQNRYDEARQLSAGNALDFVDYLHSFPHVDSISTEATELLQLHCIQQGDSAICSFYIEDEVGEKVPDTLVLKKIKGRWLVFTVESFKVTPLDSLREGDEDILFQPSDTTDPELE